VPAPIIKEPGIMRPVSIRYAHRRRVPSP